MPTAWRWPGWSRAPCRFWSPARTSSSPTRPTSVASYAEFLRMQFRAVAAAMGITYEQLTGDLTGVNYSSIRAGLLEFRRRCEMPCSTA
jgi:capsid protein